MSDRIGGRIGFRLPESQKVWVEQYAATNKTTPSDVLRTIITEYTRNPEPLASAFVDRIEAAIRLRERRPAETKERILLVIATDTHEALRDLSSQTGATIDALISLMINGVMRREEVKSKGTTPWIRPSTEIERHHTA